MVVIRIRRASGDGDQPLLGGKLHHVTGLALGLSEMSAGRAYIDSLFIDEGFASLDEDYLERLRRCPPWSENLLVG